jgi:putative ABC transport system permease protein
MLNVGAMARNETVQQFRAMGTDILALRYEGSFGGFAVADVAALPGAVPGVTEVAPIAVGGRPRRA